MQGLKVQIFRHSSNELSIYGKVTSKSAIVNTYKT